MRLWLSHSSEVPLREQLVTQLRLGIISGDLEPRQKLPSTRELARRFHIHANTVSAAYRELQRGGWVEFRKGSGVYVCRWDEDANLEGVHKLDHLIAELFRVARQDGFTLKDIRKHLSHWVNLPSPDHLLVIEPDEELRGILIAEIEAVIPLPARGASPASVRNSDFAGATPVAMYSQAENVRAVLRPGVECMLLHSTSVVERLKGEQAPPPDALIAVVSRWPGFLKSARAILIAAGIDRNVLDLRDARRPGWQKGLHLAGLVVTDSVNAAQLPKGCVARVIRLISDASIAELKSYVEHHFN